MSSKDLKPPRILIKRRPDPVEKNPVDVMVKNSRSAAKSTTKSPPATSANPAGSAPKVTAIAARPTTQAASQPTQPAPAKGLSGSAVSLLGADRSFNIDSFKAELRESQSAFTVVGVLGCQGCGKSTLLNQLAQDDEPFSVAEGGLLTEAQTMGIDAWVTPQQVILLDMEPVLHSGGHARDLAAAVWLCSVCDVLIVVQDYVMNIEVLKMVRAAEMLSGLEGAKHHSALAFVFNKLSSELEPDQTSKAQAFLSAFFDHTVDHAATHAATPAEKERESRRAANHLRVFFLPDTRDEGFDAGLETLQAFVAGFPQRATKTNAIEWADEAAGAWSGVSGPEGPVAGLAGK